MRQSPTLTRRWSIWPFIFLRSGQDSERLDFTDGSVEHDIGQGFKFLPRRRHYLDGIATHEDGRASRDRLLPFQRGSPSLFTARIGNEAIPEVFENRTIFFKEDLNGNLSTFVIRDELDSSHGSIPSLCDRVFELVGMLSVGNNDIHRAADPRQFSGARIRYDSHTQSRNTAIHRPRVL